MLLAHKLALDPNSAQRAARFAWSAAVTVRLLPVDRQRPDCLSGRFELIGWRHQDVDPDELW
jgi:hypothetical protein